jgi:hypothetical protein
MKRLVENKRICEKTGTPDPELPHSKADSFDDYSQWNISVRVHEEEAAKDLL